MAQRTSMRTSDAHVFKFELLDPHVLTSFYFIFWSNTVGSKNPTGLQLKELTHPAPKEHKD